MTSQQRRQQETHHLWNNTRSTDLVTYVTHLFNVSQSLYGQTHDVAARFCREVTECTQRRAYLVLAHQKVHSPSHAPPHASLSLPVQFCDIHYGTLHIVPDCANPASPAIPLETSIVLATVCALLLQVLEITAFVQAQSQGLEYQMNGDLTKREREILSLMFHRCDIQEMADRLSISDVTVRKHRQHIYECLGVHCEYDALLVAYRTGILSILQEISSPTSE